MNDDFFLISIHQSGLHCGLDGLMILLNLQIGAVVRKASGLMILLNLQIGAGVRKASENLERRKQLR